jgi:16S rRNA (cytosine967-C5)-methyltransferase
VSSPIDVSRKIAFDVLRPFANKRVSRRHVEDLLSQAYEYYHLEPQSRRFTTYLTYGVLRHWFILDVVIDQLSRLPRQKLDPIILVLLKMGLFQLYAMDQVPDYAAVSSTLEMAEGVGLSQKGRGFINAVLQQFIRTNKALPEEGLSVFPVWWQNRLCQQYSEAVVSALAATYSSVPKLSIRVNTLKVSVEQYQQVLLEADVSVEPSVAVPAVFFLNEACGDPTQLPGYEDGWFVVQDESSARVVPLLDPQPGETILEIGAAPGSKTMQLADCMQNQGRVIAVDVSEKRMARVLENANRLGVTIVEPVIAAGEALDPHVYQVDRVLVDAPCSGSGTLNKHPEILLSLKETEFQGFAQMQLNLLEKAFSCLKPQGVLVYSTCSIDQVENQDVIKAFSERYSKKALQEKSIEILPDGQHDGFFIARFRKLV